MSNIIAVGYNPTGTPIPGTTQYGTLVVGTTEQDYSGRPGNIDWWSSPDLDLIYVIGAPNMNCDTPTPIEGKYACLSFYGSVDKTEQSYIDLVNYVVEIYGLGLENFVTSSDAHNWVLSNGLWGSYLYETSPTITNTLLCNSQYNDGLSAGSLDTNTIEAAPQYDFFDSKEIKNPGKVEFQIQEGSFSAITESNPEFVKLQLPDYRGDKYLLNLRKNNWVPSEYRVLVVEDGIKNVVTTRSKFVSYEIFNDDGIIGSALLQDNNMIAKYSLSGETSTLYKLNTKYYNVISEENDEEFVCGSELLESLNEIDLDSLSERLTTTDASTEQICISLLYEIPYNTYSAITTIATYDVQEFVEIQNAYINQIYNTSPSNGNWNFSIAGIVQYTTLAQDPYKLTPSNLIGYYSYMNLVKNYAINNYQHFNYDHLFQINRNSIPSYQGLNGIAGDIAGMFTNDNYSLVFKYEIFNEFQLMNSLTFYDVKVVSHEMGHTLAALHTFQNGTYNYSGVTVSGPISECGTAPCSTNVNCKTIMSYCGLSSGLQLKFHPQRMTDMYNAISLLGPDLICTDSTPTNPYITLSITETNLTTPSNNFNVKYKACSATTWTNISTVYSYADFPLNILISDLDVESDCYDFMITETVTSTYCSTTIEITAGGLDFSPPSPSPTPSVDGSGLQTVYAKFNLI
jgi:hypothetical protein